MYATLTSEPIAALATPPGHSGVAIIRLSGTDLWPRLVPMLRHPNGQPVEATLPPARVLHRMDLIEENRQILDQALVVFFPAPHSFTGEDQVEIQGHGAPVVVARILERLAHAGIRLAEPGEFSRRAFLNGKSDLTQSEALMNLIHAASLRAAREAARQMEGSLSQRLLRNRTLLLEALAHLEATLDFADEEIEPDDEQAIVHRLVRCSEDLGQLLQGAVLGRQLAEGFQLAIIGRPNVGKSSLFNRLLQQERAIVTAHPGTTRDILEGAIDIHGIPVRLTDTAGLRETAESIEQEGIRRARAQIDRADAVLLLLDATEGLRPEDRDILATAPPERTLLVWNKRDRVSSLPPFSASEAPPWEGKTPPMAFISCLNGEGIEDLLEKIAAYFGTLPVDGEGSVVMVARQKEALQQTISHLARAEAVLLHGQNEELVALSLREALHALGQLVGETSQEDLLDLIFGSFCLGK